jgi:hypothetical protein
MCKLWQPSKGALPSRQRGNLGNKKRAPIPLGTGAFASRYLQTISFHDQTLWLMDLAT